MVRDRNSQYKMLEMASIITIVISITIAITITIPMPSQVATTTSAMKWHGTNCVMFFVRSDKWVEMSRLAVVCGEGVRLQA